MKKFFQKVEQFQKNQKPSQSQLVGIIKMSNELRSKNVMRCMLFLRQNPVKMMKVKMYKYVLKLTIFCTTVKVMEDLKYTSTLKLNIIDLKMDVVAWLK